LSLERLAHQAILSSFFPYCVIVTVSVTCCVSAAPPLTALAVTTTGYVPVGVVDEDGVELPPQPTAVIKPLIIRRAISSPPTRLVRYLRRVARTPASNRLGRKKIPASFVLFCLRLDGSSELVCTLVAIVSCVITAALLPPKLTTDGLKEHVAAAGRPLHAKVAAPWKLPVGINVSASVPEAPLLIVSVADAAETAKPEATVVSLSAFEVEVA
jgi:hypothetical protein